MVADQPKQIGGETPQMGIHVVTDPRDVGVERFANSVFNRHTAARAL